MKQFNDNVRYQNYYELLLGTEICHGTLNMNRVRMCRVLFPVVLEYDGRGRLVAATDPHQVSQPDGPAGKCLTSSLYL